MVEKKRRFGIASVLTLTFGGLVAVSLGTLLFLSIGSTLEATKSTLASRLETLIGDAAQQSQIYFEAAETQALWLANAFANGEIDALETKDLTSILIGAVSTLPQVSAVSYQYPDGSGLFFDASPSSARWFRLGTSYLRRRHSSPAP